MPDPLKIAGTPEGSRLACAVALINLAVHSDEDWTERRRYLAQAIRKIRAVRSTIDGWPDEKTSPIYYGEIADQALKARSPAPKVAPVESSQSGFGDLQPIHDFIMRECEIGASSSISESILYRQFTLFEKRRGEMILDDESSFVRRLMIAYPSIRRDVIDLGNSSIATLVGVRPRHVSIVQDHLNVMGEFE